MYRYPYNKMYPLNVIVGDLSKESLTGELSQKTGFFLTAR